MRLWLQRFKAPTVGIFVGGMASVIPAVVVVLAGIGVEHLVVGAPLLAVFEQQEAARRAAEAECENPLPNVGEWLAPGNVYRVRINGTDAYSVHRQIESAIKNLAHCYTIKNTEFTVTSENIYLPHERRRVASTVWNDTMILVLERKR